MFSSTEQIFEALNEIKHNEDNTVNGLSPDYIIQKVCLFRNLSENVMRMKWRRRDVIMVRQECQYFLKQETKLSLAEIGEKTGNKDHATVLHAVRTITNLVEASRMSRKTYHIEIENISRAIYGLEPLPIPMQERRVVYSENEKHLEQASIVSAGIQPKVLSASVKIEKPAQADPPINRNHPSWPTLRKTYERFRKDSFASNCF